MNKRVEAFFSLDKLVCMFHVELDKHVVKKNNRPIWRGRIGKSKELIHAEDYLKMAFRSQANQQDVKTPIDYPVWLIMHFYFPKEKYFTKESKYKIRSQKVPDLSNMYEIVQDALQASGVILNDNLVESHDYSRRLVGDKTLLEVFILKYDNYT